MTDYEQLLEDYLNGELAAADMARLRDWLLEDESDMRLFIRVSHQHGILRDEIRGMEELADYDDVQPAAAKSPCQSQNKSLLTSAYCFFAQPTPLSMTVAAIVVGLIITAMGFMVPPFYRAMTRNDDEGPPGQYDIVAEVTGLYDVVWANDAQSSPHRGAFLVPGRKLQLKSGQAEVTFRNGAVVVVEGPCNFSVESRGLGNLYRGKLAARVNEQARGFTITTPFGPITDLGTEFGVQAGDNSANIEVFVGLVEFESYDGNSIRTRRIPSGNAVNITRVDGELHVSQPTRQKDSQLSAFRRRIREVKDAKVARSLALLQFTGADRGNRNDYSGVVGTQFNVRAAVTINALGFEDPEGDGLHTSHPVGIWNSRRELVASGVVPEGTAGQHIGGWRYVRLNEQIELQADETYIMGAVVYQGGDAWTDGKNNSPEDSGLRHQRGLRSVAPVNVHLPGETLVCPTLDGTGREGQFRWSPANATLLDEFSNQR